MTRGAAALPPREAYRLWAGTYEEETVLSALDERAVKALSPAVFSRLLDAACGTGRRLPEARAVGVDAVYEMLASRRPTGRPRRVAVGDLLALPFRAGAFDLVWCRLAVGHIPRLGALYAELSRVLDSTGELVVTDLHPEAARKGHVRSFQAADGTWLQVEHTIHDAAAHEREAGAAGLATKARLDVTVGPETRALFEAIGEGARYQRLEGLPVLLAYRFSKTVR